MRPASWMPGATAAKCTRPTLTYHVGNHSSLLRFESTFHQTWLAAEQASRSACFDLQRFQVWQTTALLQGVDFRLSVCTKLLSNLWFRILVHALHSYSSVHLVRALYCKLYDLIVKNFVLAIWLRCSALRLAVHIRLQDTHASTA